MTTIVCRNNYLAMSASYPILYQREGTMYGYQVQAAPLSSTLDVQEQGWTYLAFTMDGTASRTYINGVQVLSMTAIGVVASANTTLGLEGGIIPGYLAKTGTIEFDTVKFSNIALTEAQILSNTGMLFGNKFQWVGSSGYSFYNYGANKSILNVTSYDPGYTKTYNTVTKEGEVDQIYRTNFTVTPNTSLLSVYAYNGKKVGMTTFTTMDGVVASLDKFKENWHAYGSSGSISIDIKNPTYEDMYKTSLYVRCSTSTLSLSINENYAGGYSGGGTGVEFAANFILQNTDSDFTAVNTGSLYAFGVKKEYILSAEGKYTSAQFSRIAAGILDTYSTPKIRMKIKTRFLEGDLDLFSRVTVNWQPDTRDGYIHWDKDNWDEGKMEKYTGESIAGHITWTTKDFWIIGIEHDYNGQSSQYMLREV